MKVHGWLKVSLVGLAIASILVAPAAADKIVDRARDADRVDGFHAVGAGTSSEERGRRLVATDRRGRLPDHIVRRVAHADDANRLGGYEAERYARRCDDGSLGGFAVVPGGTGPDWTDVEGIAYLKFTGAIPPKPGFPPDSCGSAVPRARRVAVGTYEIAPYNMSIPCGTPSVSPTNVATVTVRDARPLFATYETNCGQHGPGFVVRVFDPAGTPADAGFTLAILRAPTVFLP